MKLITCLVLLAFSTATLSKEATMNCASDLTFKGLNSDDREVLGDNYPFGLWKNEEYDMILRFFPDQNAYKIGRFRFIPSMFGTTGESDYVSICVFGERAFFLDEDGYHEFYVKDNKELFIASDEFDPEDNEPRSEFEFQSAKKAEVVIRP